MNKLPSQLEFNTSNRTIRLAWLPQRVYMNHYLASNEIQDRSQIKSLEFLPLQSFEIKIFKDRERESDDDFGVLGKSHAF